MGRILRHRSHSLFSNVFAKATGCPLGIAGRHRKEKSAVAVHHHFRTCRVPFVSCIPSHILVALRDISTTGPSVIPMGVLGWVPVITTWHDTLQVGRSCQSIGAHSSLTVDLQEGYSDPKGSHCLQPFRL